MFRLEDLPVGHQNGTFHYVLELSNVAAPLARTKNPGGLAGDGQVGDAALSPRFVDEVFNKQWDILASLTKGGELYGEHAEAIIKIFTEEAVDHHVFQIAIGGCNNTHIALYRLGSANRCDCFFLQRPQKLSLHGSRYFADLIQKKSATLGDFEPSFAPGVRPGECALFMPEQFGFEQCFRHGGAIDGHKGFSVATRRVVDVPSRHFLAGSSFPQNKHRSRASGHPLAQIDSA